MHDSFVTLWTVAHHAPLSMVFPRQECWNKLPFPFPGDLPDPGIELASSTLAGGFCTSEPPGKPSNIETEVQINFNTLIPFFLCSYLWILLSWFSSTSFRIKIETGGGISGQPTPDIGWHWHWPPSCTHQ